MAPTQPTLGTFAEDVNTEPKPPRQDLTTNRDGDGQGDVKGGLVPPSRFGKDGRSYSNASIFGPRTASLANSIAPGSFSSNLKSTTPRTATRQDFTTYAVPNAIDSRAPDDVQTERRQAEFVNLINKETKIKVGSENLLEALQVKNSKQTKEQRLRVESELTASNRKIAALQSQLKQEVERSKLSPTPVPNRLSSLLQKGRQRSGSQLSQATSVSELPEEAQDDDESPTFVLAELLEALEVLGMQPSYYVQKANELVSLLKRHATLKYDLAWSIFGLRVQTMLLSENREVKAAGFRVTRHAIGDRKSLQMIRSLNTDSMVVLSLAKDPKSIIEKEQALKLIRAFLDVSDGVDEISDGVIRAVVAVAADKTDALRHAAQLTAMEVLVKSPEQLARNGGIRALSDALRDGHYSATDGLLLGFLHLVDSPKLRGLLQSNCELLGPFTTFTDSLAHGTDERLQVSLRAISTLMSSWAGLFALSTSGFSSLSSLLLSISHPNLDIKNVILDFLFDILHIRPPSWASPFLAGRRLTTYARVAKAQIASENSAFKAEAGDDGERANLVDHYTSLLLLVLVRCGLIEALSTARDVVDDLATARKTIVLLSEVLRLCESALPRQMAAKLQMIPIVAHIAADDFSGRGLDIGADLAFELDSINRSTQQTGVAPKTAKNGPQVRQTRGSSLSEVGIGQASPDMDDVQFKSLLIETRVVGSPKYRNWKWDLINNVIDGPMQNPKRMDEMIRSTKFLKRLMGFYRPFKERFSEVRNTKPNQRYVRTGCALMKALLKTQEGMQYLMDNKVLIQLADCLAQLDSSSQTSNPAPMFSRDHVNETLSGGYFAILGALGSSAQGLLLLSRWRMINTFYHLLDDPDREDIIQLLLASLDYTIDSHLRLLLGRALTALPKAIRIFATKLLRKYATNDEPSAVGLQARTNAAYWAIRLLITQLYDPEIEVSEVAVQILQEACNRQKYLEYVVRCRPALDHLGEIGAPLLLRFLSTSLGYEYLHGLDYITQEMDDWFLGRNEKYVAAVEVSLFKALSREVERPKSAYDEPIEWQRAGTAPPHFYRELIRTKEGCALLRESGHFGEFVKTIREHWDEAEEPETMLKVKGCLWAVGNVGSMELGATLLEQSKVIDSIVDIAEKSAVVSMKATAFFVLGLISRSLHGMELLVERGWNAAVDEFGCSRGCILPTSLESLFPVRSA